MFQIKEMLSYLFKYDAVSLSSVSDHLTQTSKILKSWKYVCLFKGIWKTLWTELIHTCIIRRVVTGVVSVCATWVDPFLSSMLRPNGEILLRQKQSFLQTVRGFLQKNGALSKHPLRNIHIVSNSAGSDIHKHHSQIVVDEHALCLIHNTGSAGHTVVFLVVGFGWD